MADQGHLEILNQGIDTWNEWREEEAHVIPNLTEANLPRAYLPRANLIGADLSGANLSGANLTLAPLSMAKLSEANLSKAELVGANLIGADLSGANLLRARLTGADLGIAKLIKANLTLAELDVAKLIEADLTGSNLKMIRALKTNFQNAILTGACIEDWNINSETNLNGVICDYIYSRENKQERRPSDPNKNFAPGEFTKLFTRITKTVDLIFKDGIDWQIFLKTFQELRVESDTGELPVVQTIENKGDGAFVIRVKVPNDVDEGEYEQKFRQKYELQLEAKDEKIKLLGEQKDFYYQQVETIRKDNSNIRKDNTRLIRIVETMAEKQGSQTNMNFYGTVTNAASEVKGDQIGTQHNYPPEQKQTLASAAAEIQNLLKQLEKSNPTATVEQQEAFVEAAVSPNLKARFASALQAGWKEAVKELLDNPYANVAVALLEGWQEAE